ncbi:hypothetical protein F5880DRAFT_1617760 [Lentinula raphanica]|nr:hypothetical protein F5880DRAFT_1617760 [Lentinula raphanica]
MSSSIYNSNWGGKRIGAGRRKKLPPFSQQTDNSNRPDDNSTSNAAASRKSGSWRPWMITEQPTAGFFAPRSAAVRASPSALMTSPEFHASSSQNLNTLESESNNASSSHSNSNNASRQDSTSDASMSTSDEARVQTSHLSSESFARIHDDLKFIHDHDEHADIATKADTIDDSLVDDILQSNQDISSTALNESQDSEVLEHSCHQQQLQSALHQIQKEIETHGQPNCYSRGDFFFRSKHPIFALHDAKLAGLQPDRLCHRDIFIWLPSYLPGAPDHFTCTCGLRLSKNEQLMYCQYLLGKLVTEHNN